MVLGTPGSGKSYAVVNSYIRQQIEKGFAMYIYDFKFDDLSLLAYNHMLRHLDAYPTRPRFCVINFDDPRRSEPLQSHRPGVYDRHLGRLRVGLYHHAEPEQDVDPEAGRLLRRFADYPAGRDHLVPEDL